MTSAGVLDRHEPAMNQQSGVVINDQEQPGPDRCRRFRERDERAHEHVGDPPLVRTFSLEPPEHWLALAGLILFFGTKRIRSVSFATSRRNAYRVTLKTPIDIDDVCGELVDISVGGAAVRFPLGTLPSTGLVQFHLPGAQPIKIEMIPLSDLRDDFDRASLRALDTDWTAFREMSLWLFHTPANAVAGLLPGAPVIATFYRPDRSPKDSGPFQCGSDIWPWSVAVQSAHSYSHVAGVESLSSDGHRARGAQSGRVARV